MPITDPDKIRNAALKMITRRPLTAKELVEKLRRKSVPAALAEETTAEFYEKGYIDEKAIAEDHIRYVKEHKLGSRFLVRYELKGRGLGEQVIEENLELHYPDSDEIIVARKLAARKEKTLSELPIEVKERRLGGALQRKGFPGDVIASVIREQNY